MLAVEDPSPDSWHALLTDAVAEISRREPGYLERFGVAFRPFEVELERLSRCALFAGLPVERLGEALSAALRSLSAHPACRPGQPDGISEMLLDSSMDAHGATWGLISLRPRPRSRDIRTVLAEDYEERRTRTGARYFVRTSGTVPLVVINAIAIPLDSWACFLGDATHPFRVILTENHCGDLVAGGMPQYSDTIEDAAGILDVLRCENEDSVDVLGWCSGSRAAIEIARACPTVVRKLILVAPALPGDTQWGGGTLNTSFESTVYQVFAALQRAPHLAAAFMRALRTQMSSADWNALAESPDTRARALFRLPPREHAESMLLPLSNLDWLSNYGRRGVSDAAYPLVPAIAAIRAPTLLITGGDDTVIDNGRVEAMLAPMVAPLVRVTVKAAGHHIQDLQYPYFRMVLESFLLGGQLPPSTARLQVI